ncbi:hypothetical protein Ahy_B01g052122 [Arachis hypogaea]|uniref:Thiamine pyrophosphate enzyme TPP-binding domain-containing protein n=1 Tax=Arachis hypogaea TaxID=3818 RepID=A0A445ANS9_ARAHY|nr:hypothetical protein Ahy_B01g052122 [Arachis hypogaea]
METKFYIYLLLLFLDTNENHKRCNSWSLKPGSGSGVRGCKHYRWTWGTIGVGLRALQLQWLVPIDLLLRLKGILDSNLLHVVVIVFKNGSVYGGNRKIFEEMNGPHKDDPTPTSFVLKAGYHTLIEAFGGKDYLVGTPDEFKFALSKFFENRPLSMLLLIPMLVQRVGGCNTRTDF